MTKSVPKCWFWPTNYILFFSSSSKIPTWYGPKDKPHIGLPNAETICHYFGPNYIVECSISSPKYIASQRTHHSVLSHKQLTSGSPILLAYLCLCLCAWLSVPCTINQEATCVNVEASVSKCVFWLSCMRCGLQLSNSSSTLNCAEKTKVGKVQLSILLPIQSPPTHLLLPKWMKPVANLSTTS